jgi:NitT/TauT family transport system substrate-binding protein
MSSMHVTSKGSAGRPVAGVLIAVAALFLLATTALLVTTATAQSAGNAPLKKVRYATGSPVINVAYPWITLPIVLGYWKQEGYDVDVVGLQGGTAAVQQAVAGNVQILQANSSTLVQANVTNNTQFRAVMLNTVNDWSVVALDDGPIHDFKDFKGKSIGVPTLATGGIPLLREYLLQNGMTPGDDVKIVAVGFGGLALEALRSNKVQGLMFFQAQIAGFENLGGKFRYFHGHDWHTQPDFAMAVLQKTIDTDPDMVVGIVRGSAKATLFAMTNPECARKLHWARWPDTKASGSTDEATLIKWDLHNLMAQEVSMKEAYEVSGGKLWGLYTPAEMGQLQDWMLGAKLIDHELPNASYIVNIPNFFERVNDFDHAAVIKQAEACVVE